MAATTEVDSPRIPTPLLVLAVADIVLVLVGGLLFDGLALYWCRLVSTGIGAAFLVPWCVHDVKLLFGKGSDDAGEGHSGSAARKRGRGAAGVELAVGALVVAVLAYDCVGCLMDLPRLSSPEVATLSYADCSMGGTRRGPVEFTLTGVDSETGEKVGLVASRRNKDDFDAARQSDAIYVTVSAKVRYLPNSRVVLSADFSAF